VSSECDRETPLSGDHDPTSGSSVTETKETLISAFNYSLRKDSSIIRILRHTDSVDIQE